MSNKSDLIEAIAKSADISKAAAGRVLDATIESIKKTLKKGEQVSLVGFGTFYVGKRAARAIRKPERPLRSRQRKFLNFALAKI